jgi:hypothetical protein
MPEIYDYKFIIVEIITKHNLVWGFAIVPKSVSTGAAGQIDYRVKFK